MGTSHSVEIPGGGTEGYHVLRVSLTTELIIQLHFFSVLHYFLKLYCFARKFNNSFELFLHYLYFC